MTRWLQDKPRELCDRLHRAAQSDLRERDNADVARAVMYAARDMIQREVLDMEMNDMAYTKVGTTPALHWSWGDRVRDALDCLRGRARVLRR